MERERYLLIFPARFFTGKLIKEWFRRQAKNNVQFAFADVPTFEL